MRSSTIRSLAAAIVATLAATNATAAPTWRAPAERRARLVDVANRHKLAKAHPRTIAALQRTLGLRGLSPERVRIVEWNRAHGSQFLNFSREIGQIAGLTGIAATPHRGGSHPHAIFARGPLPGELGRFAWQLDTIQNGWAATYHDAGHGGERWSKSRTEPLDRVHGSKPRIFCLWLGPDKAVDAVGRAAHAKARQLRDVGQNCAVFTTSHLRQLGRSSAQDSNNPFRAIDVQRLGGRVAPHVLERAGPPDLIIHAVQPDAFRQFATDPAQHRITFGHERR